MRARLVASLVALATAPGCLVLNAHHNDLTASTGDTEGTSTNATDAPSSAATDASSASSTTTSTATSTAADATSASESDTAASSSGTTAAPAICGNGVLDPGEVCDDGDADDANGCTHDCLPTPKEIVVGAPTMAPIHGSGGGGSDSAFCPPGSVIRGVRVTPEAKAESWVSGLQFHCGYPKLQGLTVIVAPGQDLPDWQAGNYYPPKANDLVCPIDQVVVAVIGSSGAVLDNLGIKCAPLLLGPTPTSYIINQGPTTTLGPHGGANGGNFDDPCPGAATGAFVNLGSWVNSFAVMCSPLTVG